jgi:hypothetical protein
MAKRAQVHGEILLGYGLWATGYGFWKTATGRGNYNHYFADPVTGQAGWMGTMKEKGGTLLMAWRHRTPMIGSSVPYHFNSPWPALSGR